ncbi:MAG: 4-(cytidine 5'-diphospho)-2-C-methyl-D-erythritol kinase [Candidatus Kapaibacterium sp.]
MSLDVISYAKINLGLEILFKREDGYHELNTVFKKISLHDSMSIKIREEPGIEITSNLNIPIKQNLIYKAFTLFQNHYLINNNGISVNLVKRIPAGAGLGGGSSNAASVLLAMNELYETHKNISELSNLALELGADVPFFLGGNTALGKGIGENLDYFDLVLPYAMLLVNPGIHVSTKDAYTSLELTGKRKPDNLKELLIKHRTEAAVWNKFIINDFEKPIFREYPDIADIKAAMYASGALFALMSGSGSTVFGIFHKAEKAVKAAGNFSKYRTFLAEFV